MSHNSSYGFNGNNPNRPVPGSSPSDRIEWLQHSINEVSNNTTHACTSIDMMKADIERMRPDIDSISTVRIKLNIVIAVAIAVLNVAGWFAVEVLNMKSNVAVNNTKLAAIEKSLNDNQEQNKEISQKL
ncbi:hypothetical protein, partial [Vibrio sp. M260118]|uniref:hypothetical protein n=1 Tax=Vibrio sp. M260118 TaxID=3020896 RepID=UPI002F41B73A